MTDTPLELFLHAFDRLDADVRAALFADHGRLRYLDGRFATSTAGLMRGPKPYATACANTSPISA